VVSVGAFGVGAGAAGLVRKRTADRDRTLVVRALTVEVSLLSIAAILAAVVAVTPGAVSGYIEIMLLALAMGMRTAVVARFGGPDLTLTMLTGTLAALAANLPFTGGSDNGSGRRIAAAPAPFFRGVCAAVRRKPRLWLP